MNTESPQALLHLPIPERSGLSFCQASPWALERWIAELPKANPAAFAQRLHLGLLELVQLRTPAENRLQLLELFRAEIHFLGEHLEFYFLQPGRVLDERAHEVASLCQTLQRQLAIGYEQLIALEEPGPPEQPDSRLLSAMAIQRALYALNATLIRAKQLHSLPPAGLWLEMHSLYRIARAWDLQRLSMHDQPSGQASPTIERTYLASLMLGVARCNQMSRTDIAGLARALKSWSGLVCLREEVEACPLLVDLGRDSPPCYRRLCEPGTAHDRLGIDPGVLLGVLEACLQQEKDARHSLPALPGGIGVELLEHLRSAWGDLVHRACLRAPGDGRLGAIFGMNAVHYHLAGRRPFAEVLRRPQESCRVRFQANRGDLEDVWNWASGVRSLARRERGPTTVEAVHFERPTIAKDVPLAEPEAEDHPILGLPIIDQGPGGYGLFWPDAPPGCLQVGELIGMQAAPGQGWAVGVVRWIRRIDEGIRLGIELLAAHAEPCGVRLIGESQLHGQYLRALQLPAGDACPASLLTASLPFRKDSRVWINRNGEEQLAVLTRRLANAGRFNRFEYHLSGQGKTDGWTLL